MFLLQQKIHKTPQRHHGESALCCSECVILFLPSYLVVSPYEILRNNIGFINDAVSGRGQPAIVVSCHLLQQGLISQADHDAVVTPCGLSPSQVVAQLMTPVTNQIKYVPGQYQNFLTALRNANLDFIVEKLEEQPSSTCKTPTASINKPFPIMGNGI